MRSLTKSFGELKLLLASSFFLALLMSLGVIITFEELKKPGEELEKWTLFLGVVVKKSLLFNLSCFILGVLVVMEPELIDFFMTLEGVEIDLKPRPSDECVTMFLEMAFFEALRSSSPKSIPGST